MGARVYGVGARVYGAGARVYGVGARVYGSLVIIVSAPVQRIGFSGIWRGQVTLCLCVTSTSGVPVT